jgi:hypothetical protein
LRDSIPGVLTVLPKSSTLQAVLVVFWSDDQRQEVEGRFSFENPASRIKKTKKPASFSRFFLVIGDQPWLDFLTP